MAKVVGKNPKGRLVIKVKKKADKLPAEKLAIKPNDK